MRARTLFLLGSLAVAVTLVVLARGVILPFVLALVLAYVLMPLVAWAEQRKIPRAGAVVLVYVIVIGAMVVFVRAITPRVGNELRALRQEAPALITRLQNQELPMLSAKLASLGGGAKLEEPREHDVDPHASFVLRPSEDGESFSVEMTKPIRVRPDGAEGFVVDVQEPEQALDLQRVLADGTKRTIDMARRNVGALLHFTQQVVAQVWHAIFVFSITLMLAAYLMITRERIMGFFEGLVRPQHRESYRALLARIDRGLSGVVRGQLVICLVNGVLSAIGFAFIGLKYWPVLALLATLLSIIPIFGALISSVPAVLFGLTDGIGTALFVLAWIVGIHQIEANFLNPKIMGDAAKVHPVLVVFSLLAGEHLFQVWGALLAVPVLSILLSLFTHFRQRFDAEDPDFAERESDLQ